MWQVVSVLLLTASVLGSCPDRCRCPSAEDDVLVEVHCNNASLTDLPVGGLQETFFLDLAFNNITTLKNDGFKDRNWLKVERLYLDRNGLKTIEEHAFRGLSQLKILNLGSNDLTKITADVFATNVQLEALGLNGNTNIELPNTGFNLPNLDNLSLRSCGLTKIPSKFFQNMTRLHLVFLQGNELSSFDPLLVSPLTQLGHLDLRDNLFTSLPVDLVRWMPQTLRLRLEGNPFKCACAMADVYSLYRSRHYHEELSCLDPSDTSLEEFFTSRCNQTNQEASEAVTSTLSIPPSVTTAVTTAATTPVTTMATKTTVNDTTTTTVMPPPATPGHLWLIIISVALAVVILIAIVCAVIRRKRFARGYTVHRTFTTLDDDDEEQNFIT